jgi:predicted GNAT family N-acyltransferase
MRNRDIVELFDLVPPYTPVDIVEFRVEAGSWADFGAAARPVREAVFVRGQAVPPASASAVADAAGWHAVARDPAGQPIGTGRLLPDGDIGRLAVVPDWRGKGVGRALLETLMEVARERRTAVLQLHAQTAAAGFYSRFGFRPEGGEFMVAGIAHILMSRQLA